MAGCAGVPESGRCRRIAAASRPDRGVADPTLPGPETSARDGRKPADTELDEQRGKGRRFLSCLRGNHCGPASEGCGLRLRVQAAADRRSRPARLDAAPEKPVVPNLRRGIGRLLQLPVRLYEPELARVDPQQPRDDRADLRDPAAGTIVDNTVVISETGALGAGSSSPEMRANQPLAINVEGLDVRETSVGRQVPSPCSSRDGRPVRVPLLRRGPPLRHPACSGLLRVGQPAFVDRVPDAERTQGRPTDAVCKDLCRWDPDGIGSADKEITEFSNGGNRNE